MVMDLNYFICTLGQAAQPEISRPFRNVNHLINQQALNHPNLPAVGLYSKSQKQNDYDARTITFKEIFQGVTAVADAIASIHTIPPAQTVGLLCSSSPAFLFTWLGLIWLGHPVLLIAPQCSATAIAHLAKSCSSPNIFHDDTHEKLACEAAASSTEIDFADMRIWPLPFKSDDEVFEAIRKANGNNKAPADVKETDVAYLHHTSGTSTGIPKPIPQTHHGGVGVLPKLDGSSAATFTTTPLYHGGVADLFRAWTSAATIWLFPAQYAPITASNIVSCLKATDIATRNAKVSPLRYFSSVPYVLQMMAEYKEGLKHLQDMAIVGVGGAALPPTVGDRLVHNKVNLVSRYGNAECGFMMSSHRVYAEDKEWRYLRQPAKVKSLQFIKQESGLRELVILPGWPHMAKTNKDDGSFASADLFVLHHSIPNAWEYHSRADSQLTLITGKKFDPAPYEGSLAASLSSISEVLVFGNGQPYPGAFLFRSEYGMTTSDKEIINQIAPIVEKLNLEAPNHARIPRNMLIPMPFEASPLEKSSKGTILRSRAENKYNEQIVNAYNKINFHESTVLDCDLEEIITKMIKSVVRTHDADDQLNSGTDLFAFGVDSMACIQIRHALTQLIPRDTEPLPMTVVEDSGNIARLSAIIAGRRRGQIIETSENPDEVINRLVNKYSSFAGAANVYRNEIRQSQKCNVLLTGPTGLLGAHVLSQLLQHRYVDKVYLLVRGTSLHAARERVLKSLHSRRSTVPPDFDQRVCILPCKLSEANLGLSLDEYESLLDNVDKIFHLAWAVNFLVSLHSLAATHLAGLHNLLNLALASKRNPHFLFCSSVASVSNLMGKRVIPERPVEDLTACGPTGYAQSKLAAELICAQYARKASQTRRMSVIRVGQLSGDTAAGVWNSSEAFPLMLASSKTTGVLPDLRDETLNWLPVDIAARAFIEVAFNEDTTVSTTESKSTTMFKELPAENGDGPQSIEVLHLLNTAKSTSFRDLLRHLQDAKEPIKVVTVKEWLHKLNGLSEDENTRSHPALRLLSFWTSTYGSQSQPLTSAESVFGSERRSELKRGNANSPAPEFVNDGVNEKHDRNVNDSYETMLSRVRMPSMAAATGPLGREYLLKVWEWIKNNVD